MAATLNTIIQSWADHQELNAAQKKIEKELRPQLVKACGDVRASRYEMGRLIVEYRTHFKGTYLSLYNALGIEERTATNYRHDYERASRVSEGLRQAAAMHGYDLSEKRHEALCEALAANKDTPAAKVDAVVEAEIKKQAAVKRAARRKSAQASPTPDEPSYDDPPPARKPMPAPKVLTPKPDLKSEAEGIRAEIMAGLNQLFPTDSKAEEEFFRQYLDWLKTYRAEVNRKAA